MSVGAKWNRLRPLLITALLVVVWVVLIHPAIRSARRQAIRTVRRHNLYQLSIALRNYEVIFGRLPPATFRDVVGRPLCSWRARITPFLGAYPSIYDERWDNPANHWISTRVNDVFCWRSDLELPQNLETNIVAVTGSGTAFEEGRDVALKELDADTILAIEIADSQTHWMEPGDVHLDEITPVILHGLEGDGLHVLFADKTVWLIRPNTPLNELKKFLTIKGAKNYDREKVLRRYVLEAYEKPGYEGPP